MDLLSLVPGVFLVTSYQVGVQLDAMAREEEHVSTTLVKQTASLSWTVPASPWNGELPALSDGSRCPVPCDGDVADKAEVSLPWIVSSTAPSASNLTLDFVQECLGFTSASSKLDALRRIRGLLRLALGQTVMLPTKPKSLCLG